MHSNSVLRSERATTFLFEVFQRFDLERVA